MNKGIQPNNILKKMNIDKIKKNFKMKIKSKNDNLKINFYFLMRF